MRDSQAPHGHRRPRSLPLLLLAAGLMVLGAAQPALAHGGHRHHGPRHDRHRVVHQHRHHAPRHHRGPAYHQHRRHPVRHVRHHALVNRHGRFVVPARIHAYRARDYRPYYAGRVFHEPHGHVHVVYRFPVLTPHGAVVYRPHAYCGERLFLGGSIALGGARLHVRLGF